MLFGKLETLHESSPMHLSSQVGGTFWADTDNDAHPKGPTGEALIPWIQISGDELPKPTSVLRRGVLYQFYIGQNWSLVSSNPRHGGYFFARELPITPQLKPVWIPEQRSGYKLSWQDEPPGDETWMGLDMQVRGMCVEQIGHDYWNIYLPDTEVFCWPDTGYCVLTKKPKSSVWELDFSFC
jgi:hypothetical protein